jgi:hypothetical protein
MAKHRVWTCNYYSYWNLWKAKNGATSAPSKTGLSYKDFQNAWRTARKSGDWSIIEELVADEAEEESGPQSCKPGSPEWAGWDSFVGDPEWWKPSGGSWTPINGKRRQARRPDNQEPDQPRPRPTVNGHYVTLGITPDATRDEIRSAYRALALKHHPDHGGSVERMREINLAYAAIVG